MIDPPSVTAVKKYYKGEQSAMRDVVRTYLGRSLLLTVGYTLLGNKKTALKNGLLGSAIIEAYLFYYYSKEIK